MGHAWTGGERPDDPQSSDGAPVWEVVRAPDNSDDDSGDGDDDVSVHAAPMSHVVPCVG